MNETLLKDSLCLNLQLGGGTWNFSTEEEKHNFHAAGGRAVRRLLAKRHQEKFKNDPIYKARCIANMIGKQKWSGRSHKEESKIKIGLANSTKQKGTANSQYNTCWINKDGVCKKIKRELLEDYTNQHWARGRK